MFHSIRPEIAERMRYLEHRDAMDRIDGTRRPERLRQIPPETGRFIALMAANAPRGAFLEVGTSAGYSTLWLSLAAEVSGRRVTTYEILPEKAEMARETFRLTGVGHLVDLVPEDAREHIAGIEGIAFCFLDAEKDVYREIYEMVIPCMVQGGLFISDNAINHRNTLQPMLDRALSDPRVDAMIVPIGKGLLVCRKS